jgi:hypothetical protein
MDINDQLVARTKGRNKKFKQIISFMQYRRTTKFEDETQSEKIPS